MENNQDKELRGRLMKMAIERNPPSTLIPQHQLIQLLVQQKIPVPILFKARYPQLLLANMTSRKLFFQCLHELENMLKVSQECKAQRKKKKEKLHYDEIFITTFVDLIFGEKEKQILFKIMSQSWPMDKKERQSWSNYENERMQNIQIGQETFSYILKTIFLTDQATQSSSNSTSPDLTFDF